MTRPIMRRAWPNVARFVLAFVVVAKRFPPRFRCLGVEPDLGKEPPHRFNPHGGSVGTTPATDRESFNVGRVSEKRLLTEW